MARSLRLTEIDEADAEPANIVALLDGIDGAWEAAQARWRHAHEGDTVSFDQRCPGSSCHDRRSTTSIG